MKNVSPFKLVLALRLRGHLMLISVRKIRVFYVLLINLNVVIDRNISH